LVVSDPPWAPIVASCDVVVTNSGTNGAAAPFCFTVAPFRPLILRVAFVISSGPRLVTFTRKLAVSFTLITEPEKTTSTISRSTEAAG
jgi:hypothetical protein